MTRPDILLSARDRAQLANSLIEEAILQYLGANPNGCQNSEITRELGLHSEHNGRQRDYLVYSILGNLMRRGLVEKRRENNKSLYFVI